MDCLDWKATPWSPVAWRRGVWGPVLPAPARWAPAEMPCDWPVEHLRTFAFRAATGPFGTYGGGFLGLGFGRGAALLAGWPVAAIVTV